ncbi:TPA: hypothetical protein N0F65_003945 [Lagenidium giganteum]|uniref:Peroxin-7 n=1 Tax=Lagenidium giganteum TaxID=4803 RepID=A0AAV2YRJ8_9STRA|nr:TPA: hypothetical protein N0F65_003945 [Lagenidium giganteum]
MVSRRTRPRQSRIRAEATRRAMFLQPRRTLTEFQGYSVEFSPFQDSLVAVGTSQYFGIIGNGKQYVYEMMPSGELAPTRVFDTPDGVYDCAWSEVSPHQLVSGCANGSIKLWHLQSRDGFPIQNFHEHKQEVSGVNWSLVAKDAFVSASWDGTVKLWRPEMPHSIATLAEHTKSVNNAVWNTQNGSLIASCSGDGLVKIWDLNMGRSTTTIAAHGTEVLALDWNKYNPFEVVSGSADCSIKIWDIRNPSHEVRVLTGHNYGVRRLKCSPYDADVIASVSYDMSVGIWNTKSPYPRLQTASHHREFAFGVDFSLFVDGLVASCAWDRQVHVWNYFAMEAEKPGVWTEHHDAHGRKYYYNMVAGRSYWELPDELLSKVHRPMIDTMREWQPALDARKQQQAQEEAMEKRKSEIMAMNATGRAGSDDVSSERGNNSTAALSLEERMALAAQKKADEMKRVAQQKAKQDDNDSNEGGARSNEYLAMVRQLQDADKDSETSGGKWLVR